MFRVGGGGDGDEEQGRKQVLNHWFFKKIGGRKVLCHDGCLHEQQRNPRAREEEEARGGRLKDSKAAGKWRWGGGGGDAG